MKYWWRRWLFVAARSPSRPSRLVPFFPHGTNKRPILVVTSGLFVVGCGPLCCGPFWVVCFGLRASLQKIIICGPLQPGTGRLPCCTQNGGGLMERYVKGGATCHRLEDKEERKRIYKNQWLYFCFSSLDMIICVWKKIFTTKIYWKNNEY